jgi:hypothetical protein
LIREISIVEVFGIARFGMEVLAINGIAQAGTMQGLVQEETRETREIYIA